MNRTGILVACAAAAAGLAVGFVAGTAHSQPPFNGAGPEIRVDRLQRAQDEEERAQAAREARAVRAVLSGQQAAWNRGDVDTFMDGYWKSDELRFASGGHETKGWRATLARYHQRYNNRAKMGHLSFSGLDVRVLSDNAVLVFGHWKLERAKDTPGGLFTLLFRKIDGRWVIVHDHTSSG